MYVWMNISLDAESARKILHSERRSADDQCLPIESDFSLYAENIA